MRRRFLRRRLPDIEDLRRKRGMKFLGRLLDDPYLLHLNRRSVAGGVAVGLFVAFIPLPMQMTIAALIAVVLRVNLLLSVVLVWVSNPLTMPALFYFGYLVGTWMIGPPVFHTGFEPTLHWFWTELSAIWKPLFLGCISVGAVLAMAAYGLVNLIWRLTILQALRRRRRRRARRAPDALKRPRADARHEG
jgi:uncharacterized protein (DUF2062 family)